jgi:hypothetical protein
MSTGMMPAIERVPESVVNIAHFQKLDDVSDAKSFRRLEDFSTIWLSDPLPLRRKTRPKGIKGRGQGLYSVIGFNCDRGRSPCDPAPCRGRDPYW